MKRLALTLLAIALAAPASAAFTTAGKLQKGLAAYLAPTVEQRTLQEAAEAAGYVFGITDATYGRTSCTPNGATARQVLSVVLKRLDAAPERWHESAAPQVVEALQSAFPCGKRP